MNQFQDKGITNERVDQIFEQYFWSLYPKVCYFVINLSKTTQSHVIYPVQSFLVQVTWPIAI